MIRERQLIDHSQVYLPKNDDHKQQNISKDEKEKEDQKDLSVITERKNDKGSV